MPIDELFAQYHSGEKGLSSEQVVKNRHRYGDNRLVVRAQTPLYVEAAKELFALFPLLLLASSILSLVANFLSPGEGYDLISAALFFVVILNASVSLIQKRKVAQIMQSFQSYIPREVIVIREGQDTNISADDLVVGDLVKLGEGDKIPADAQVIKVSELKVDESILTGESVAVDKSIFDGKSQSKLFSGTTVVHGQCIAIVIATGAHTQLGNISTLTQDVKERLTPMQRELNSFVKKITVIALLLGFAFFLAGTYILHNPFLTNLIFAIGIIVANVPEGLLPTVTLALTQASQKMAKRKAVVKNLESVETLGSCDVICTDKTGTLTQNSMDVVRAYLNEEDVMLSGGWSPRLDANPGLQTYMEVMTLCNDASLVVDKQHRTFFGDPTETALLKFVDSQQRVDELRSKFHVINEKPFSSEDKYMAKVFKTQGNTLYGCVKGAPEVILEQCDLIHQGGHAVPLTADTKRRLKRQSHAYERDGLRVLALAYFTDNEDVTLDGLVFVGLVGLMDPPRPEVFAAVKACQSAGIKVVVISGDTAETVKAIARQTGIANHPIAVTGSELSRMSDAELLGYLDKEVVFARTVPEQKMRIVSVLQKAGKTVAVTGDGVNDAPALKRADIGVSMGKNGTDVAKDASDIILLDDNFATIVAAVEEGRTVYENIRRFITYILTSNIPEIIPFILYVLFPIPLAITVIQILAIDLITDIVPAIGLGNEIPEKDVMNRPPRKRTERMVDFKMFLRSYGFIGPLEAILAFGAFFLVLYNGGWQGGGIVGDMHLYQQATAAFLGAIIFSQIGNVMACRTSRQSAIPALKRRNSWISTGIAIEIYFILMITTLPWLQHFFYAKPLGWYVWGLLLVCPLVIFVAEELRKWCVRTLRATRQRA